MRYLDKLLSVGHGAAMPERLARHIRVSNAVALVGVGLAAASLPFDAVSGPLWFLSWDLVALAGFASCWLLNAAGHYTIARVSMLVVANLVFAYSTVVLGEISAQPVVFFALVTVPFYVFDLDEPLLVPLVALPVAAYFVSPELGPIGTKAYSVAAYRIYSPLLAFAGLLAGSFAFARTNRRADAALIDARERAVASARMAALGEMASGIAHEIRNPLAAIHLAIDQVATVKHLEDVPRSLERCRRIAGRIAKTIDALSSFARDASGDPFVTVEVERIVADTLELCQQRFVAHTIDLQIPEVPPSLAVECRPVQISQILLNLLNNAHDAVDPLAQRWVRLEIKADADHLELAVVDSGPRIPPEVRPRLFEPFFTTKSPDRGTGLGLSLSRGLAEAHHGTLELDDRADHTRFVLRLPRRQPPAA